jgi:hypothetical protein
LRACLALLLAIALSSIGLTSPGAGPLGFDVHEAEAANAIVAPVTLRPSAARWQVCN